MTKLDAGRLEQYRALTDGFGFVEFPNSSVVSISGNDREKFLHNFCTADVKRLSELSSCEAFFLNPKGKTINHGFILKLQDRLLVWTLDSNAETLIEFLDRYLLSEDVQLELVSKDWTSVFACGAASQDGLSAVLGSEIRGSAVVECDFGFATRVELAGQGALILCREAQSEKLLELLAQNDGVKTDLFALHSLRVEQQTPWFGLEIDESNLPQELCRDEKAISFEKGCYLGQETVARLDAMGHVNQQLVCFRLPPESQMVKGQTFEMDGKVVGRLTSVAWSPKMETVIALGFVRTKFLKTENELSVGDEKVMIGF